MLNVVRPFLLRYPYSNRLKCIFCNYIYSDLFTFFDFYFRIFSNITQFVWCFSVLVPSVIFTHAIKSAQKQTKQILLFSVKMLLSLL